MVRTTTGRCYSPSTVPTNDTTIDSHHQYLLPAVPSNGYHQRHLLSALTNGRHNGRHHHCIGIHQRHAPTARTNGTHQRYEPTVRVLINGMSTHQRYGIHQRLNTPQRYSPTVATTSGIHYRYPPMVGTTVATTTVGNNQRRSPTVLTNGTHQRHGYSPRYQRYSITVVTISGMITYQTYYVPKVFTDGTSLPWESTVLTSDGMNSLGISKTYCRQQLPTSLAHGSPHQRHSPMVVTTYGVNQVGRKPAGRARGKYHTHHIYCFEPTLFLDWSSPSQEELHKTKIKHLKRTKPAT